MKDMHKTITIRTLILFVDDKKISKEVNCNLLRLTNNGLKANKLCLNPSKTDYF